MRVTFSLLLINFVVFGVQLLLPGFTDAFSLTPAVAVEGAWWQFLTYMFLHGGNVHILLNMFVLAIFGAAVEKHLGAGKYLLLYFLAGLGSAGLHVALTGLSLIPMLGASGAVFGILTAYGFLFPKNWIIMFPGIPMPAILAVFVFAGLELFLGVTGLQPGVANFGHLGGIMVGIAFMFFWKALRKSPAVGEQPATSFENFWE